MTKRSEAYKPNLRSIAPLRDFLQTESAGGALLLVATCAALVASNSPWGGHFADLWQTEFGVSLVGHTLSLDLKHWINDGLMTIFFLVVGLEIKREMTHGHLVGVKAAALPVAAALGGMVVPALLYLSIARGTAAAGWGIPIATDIALAVGVLAIASKRIAPSIRAYLLGLAVVDDIGAILVIAAFYSTGVALEWAVVSLGCLACVLVLARLGEHRLVFHLPLGCLLWLTLYNAGIHPTLAGVAMGLLAPVAPRLSRDLIDSEELGNVGTVKAARESAYIAKSSVSVVEWLQHVLHPWTSYAIVPLFALANAGIKVSGQTFTESVESPVFWGVALGLFIGKPLGVAMAAKLAIGTRVASAPVGSSWRQLLSAGYAAGIGFTVALFIADLAFDGEDPAALQHVADAKMAILVASVLSGVAALAVLRTEAAKV